MGDDHFTAPELNDFHEQSRQRNTTEGGACLTGHDGMFRKKRNKNTCNYRYQAYEQAKSEAKIKSRLESYNWSQEITTSVYQTEAGGWAPSYYSAKLPPPRKGDWDIEGPKEPIFRKTLGQQILKIPTGMNFTQDTWPYWNNAHHMIPKGLFNSMIDEQPSPVPDVMRKALLSAKYNINHKINMFMLPQDKEVASILQLTRHLQLRHDDAAGVKEKFTDHPGYSDLVRDLMNAIITGYKTICDEAKPDGHKIPKAELDRAKLENLSKDLMNMILSWGTASPGASLDKKAGESMRKEGDL